VHGVGSWDYALREDYACHRGVINGHLIGVNFKKLLIRKYPSNWPHLQTPLVLPVFTLARHNTNQIRAYSHVFNMTTSTTLLSLTVAYLSHIQKICLSFFGGTKGSPIISTRSGTWKGSRLQCHSSYTVVDIKVPHIYSDLSPPKMTSFCFMSLVSLAWTASILLSSQNNFSHGFPLHFQVVSS